jgi:transcriptional regulator with XRE-family HTH domain
MLCFIYKLLPEKEGMIMGIGAKLALLIDKRGRKVTDVAKATGVPQSTIYSIIERNNTKVDLQTLQLICDELCVTLDYFLDKPDREEEGNKEIDDYINALHNRPELRMLFSMSSKATKEQIEQTVKILKALKNEE